jgi:hypothetical protein
MDDAARADGRRAALIRRIVELELGDVGLRPPWKAKAPRSQEAGGSLGFG